MLKIGENQWWKRISPLERNQVDQRQTENLCRFLMFFLKRLRLFFIIFRFRCVKTEVQKKTFHQKKNLNFFYKKKLQKKFLGKKNLKKKFHPRPLLSFWHFILLPFNFRDRSESFLRLVLAGRLLFCVFCIPPPPSPSPLGWITTPAPRATYSGHTIWTNTQQIIEIYEILWNIWDIWILWPFLRFGSGGRGWKIYYYFSKYFYDFQNLFF